MMMTTEEKSFLSFRSGPSSAFDNFERPISSIGITVVLLSDNSLCGRQYDYEYILHVSQ